jgi:FlaA1/EpsC-like NDP-sugar epimerase
VGRDASRAQRLAVLLSRARADLWFAVVDVVLIVVSYLTAMTIRSFDGQVDDRWWVSVLSVMPFIVLVHIAANILMGAYGHVWEYASISEARSVLAASFLATGVLLTLTFALGDRPVPLSVLIAGGLLALFSQGAVRFRSRLFSFNKILQLEATDRALIIGTGKTAAALARDAAEGSAGINVIGFVSPRGESPSVRKMAGLPILGELDQIAQLVETYGVREVIVASDGASAVARELVDLCVDVDVRLRIMPGVDDVLNGSTTGVDIRDLELTDLLARPKVSTDLAAVGASLQDKVVLVTGAGGSIGSVIVDQVLRFSPRTVIAMDHDETHLHDGMLRWAEHGEGRVVAALCDLRDVDHLNRLIALHEPQVVFHAAAHKHVPILEEWPEEAVKTNVLGTARLLEALRGSSMERFILISTDKTVNPTSVMGASKRIAEMLVQAAATAYRSNGHAGCAYGSVRFGNVLGSRGSVVPTFMEQIRNGGPVTVTDERMTRYFMTTEEAVELVLQAGAMARNGDVFVLDMGQPVKIVDLAHRMIRLAGLVPGRDIEVISRGVRPGEKLYEELAHGPMRPSSHEKINVAEAPAAGPAVLLDLCNHLETLAESGESEQLKELLLAAANQNWSPGETIDLTDPSEANTWT